MQTENKKRPVGRAPREMEGRRETSDSNGRGSQLQGGSVPRRKSVHSVSNIRGSTSVHTGFSAGERLLGKPEDYVFILGSTAPKYFCSQSSRICISALAMYQIFVNLRNGRRTNTGRPIRNPTTDSILIRRAVHYHAGNPAKYIDANGK